MVSVNFLPYQATRTVETSDFLINLIFQGRSSDHFESVQSVVSAASSKIEERYSSGLIPFIIAHSIRENNRHVERAPSSEPQNKKFFLDKTYGRIERSAIYPNIRIKCRAWRKKLGDGKEKLPFCRKRERSKGKLLHP